MRNGRIDWQAVASACGIEDEMTAELKRNLRSGLEAIIRWLDKERPAEDDRPTVEQPRRKIESAAGSAKAMAARPSSSAATAPIERAQSRAKPGVQPRPIEELPTPLFDWTEDPEGFQQALIYHMRRQATVIGICIAPLSAFDHKTLLSWTKGTKVPDLVFGRHGTVPVGDQGGIVFDHIGEGPVVDAQHARFAKMRVARKIDHLAIPRLATACPNRPDLRKKTSAATTFARLIRRAEPWAMVGLLVGSLGHPPIKVRPARFRGRLSRRSRFV